MFLISHRGNINGPDPLIENNPRYIDKCISLGYDVEVDVWFLNGDVFTGHDYPQYKVSIDYLKNSKFWCHCKNIEALHILLKEDVHCFYHKTDDVTLTSRGYIWTYPKKKLMEGSVCVLPELGFDGLLKKCAGICSDYIGNYK